MAESLIFKLFISSLLCVVVLLPLYYLLGYSVLSAIEYRLWYWQFNRSQNFKFEDVLVTSIATLSLIIVGCKLVGVFPQIQLIFRLSIVTAIACLCLSFAFARLLRIKPGVKHSLPLPNWKYVLFGILVYAIYLVRTTIKAQSLANAQYIPTRFNTDLLLYIRRSIVFLGNSDRLQSQNDLTIIDILYNSPKLLSTLIYSTFTYVSGDIGVAATIIMSLVLMAITLKYLVLIKKQGNYSLTTIALITLIVFQPVWCWLHDQFYWSNLLCIYLLIYVLEDLILFRPIESKYLLKYAIALTALAGFYPSQLPFFLVAAMTGIVFHPAFEHKRRDKYLLSLILITIAIACLFFTQYFATGEVFQHFNLTDDRHGQKLNYIPFWSLLDFVPLTGGTPKDLGAILLISASLIVGLFVVKYCIKTIPAKANWFKLLYALYAVYSVSYLILPGEYRQSKFFFTYIVPLIVFCAIEVFSHTSLRYKPVFKLLFSALAIYVAIKSFFKPYKPHVSSEISEAISAVKSRNQPTLIYMYEGGIAHGYYYLAYQIRNLDFELISGCPQASDLNSIDLNKNTLVVDTSCPQIAVNPELESKIIHTDINGDDANKI